MDATLWLKLLWGNAVNGVILPLRHVHVMRAPNNLQGIQVSVATQNSPTMRQRNLIGGKSHLAHMRTFHKAVELQNGDLYASGPPRAHFLFP